MQFYDISDRNLWSTSPVTTLSSKLFAEDTGSFYPRANFVSVSATKLISTTTSVFYLYTLNCNEGLGSIFANCEMCEPGTCPVG